jgi:hypothetical protein
MLAALMALVPGERLDYDVRLGPMSVGSLELATLAPDTVQGESCRHFRATIDLSLRFVFRARYVLDAWSTSDDFVTLRSGKSTQETRYSADWTADYRYGDSMVVYSDGDTFALEGESRDLLTTWYYLRSLPLVTRDTVRFHVHSDRRDQSVTVIDRGRRSLEVAGRRFRTQELAQRGPGLVGTMFLSDDEQRLPVLIRTSISGVPVTAQLRMATTGGER